MRLVVSGGCHLCEEAEPIVRRVAARYRLPLEVVDIGSDDELVRLYSLRIPVVLDQRGVVLDEGSIDEGRLRRAVRRSRRGR